MRILPIIFQPEMVRALLAGRKTQTRRAKYSKDCAKCRGWGTLGTRADTTCPKCYGDGRIYAPLAYVQPGDALYVRENFGFRGEFADYKIRDFLNMWNALPGFKDKISYFADADGYDAAVQSWRPSIHLPRALSRLTLAVTEVRFEPVQNISEADAIAEGIEMETADPPFYYEPGLGSALTGVGIEEGNAPAKSYGKLWQHINGLASWVENPEVVALTFTVHRQNVDEFLRAGAEA